MKLTLFFALPFACLIAWVLLVARRRWTALVASVASGLVAGAIGFWAIRQSRSSTAAIGVLFLPAAGSVSALLAAAWGSWRSHARKAIRITAWTALVAAVAWCVVVWQAGRQAIATNAQADREAADRAQAHAATVARVAGIVRDHPADEEAALAAELDRYPEDRDLLLAALETPFVSEARLEALAATHDGDVLLEIARNRRTPPATLERIYREADYPPMFYGALAANPGSPLRLLRELASRARENELIVPSLAQNPSTPKDLRDAIDAGTLQ